MPNNKTQLQTNNTALDALITRVNDAKDIAASLPEVDSGGDSRTEEIYSEAIDPINSGRTYVETDKLIEHNEEITNTEFISKE